MAIARFAILIYAFAFSVLACAQSLPWQFRPSDDKISAGSQQDRPDVRNKRSHTIAFTPGPAGQAIRNGISISFQVFRCVEDEVPVQRSVETYSSTRRARAALQDVIKRSSKVIERSKVGEEGTEERAVVLRKLSKGQSEVIIIWTKGADLHAISSPSLEHALAFDKQKEQAGVE